MFLFSLSMIHVVVRRKIFDLEELKCLYWHICMCEHLFHMMSGVCMNMKV